MICDIALLKTEENLPEDPILTAQELDKKPVMVGRDM